MSGIGGGKPGERAFWDPVKGQEFTATTVKTHSEVLLEMNEMIRNLTERIENLETAYMELKMLGSDPGKIRV